MNRVFFTFVFLMTLCGSTAYAHPPKSLDAVYVLSEGKVYIFMEHLSRDHRKHYIRKVTFFKNGEDAGEVNNRQQIDPNYHSLDFVLPANEGDQIIVKVYCQEGGTKTATLSVVKDENHRDEIKGIKDKINESETKKKSADIYTSKENPFANKQDVHKKMGDKDQYKGSKP